MTQKRESRHSGGTCRKRRGKRKEGKSGTGSLRIVFNLRLEFIEPGKTSLFAQQLVQADFKRLAIKVFVQVEEMHFQSAFLPIIDRGAASDIGNTRCDAAIGMTHTHRIDAARRFDMTPERNIGRRKTEKAPAFVAMGDLTGDEPEPTEFLGRAFGISFLKKATDARRRVRPPYIRQWRHYGKTYAETLKLLAEIGDIAAPSVTKSEIGPAGNVAHAEPRMKHGLDKLIRCQMAEIGIEAKLEDVPRALLMQNACTDLRQHQTQGRVLRTKKLAWMRLESQGPERQIGARRMERSEKMDMTQMHAIEIAEGHGSSARLWRDCRPVLVQGHETGSSNCWLTLRRSAA